MGSPGWPLALISVGVGVAGGAGALDPAVRPDSRRPGRLARVLDVCASGPPMAR
jgi:hypothetical protein